MTVPCGRLLTMALLGAMVGCSTASPTPTPRGSDAISSPPPLTESGTEIVVSQTAALLTGAGQTLVLRAEATNGNGAAVPVTWHSSDPAQVSVGEDGTVTAVVEIGSAVVFAEAADEWVPVTVLIAQPVDGALLIHDEEVVSGPEPVDADAGPWVGSRMRATLTLASPPPPGTVLLANGSAPIAGRVVASAPAPGGTEVEYEVVPLPDLFAAVDLDLDIPLDLRDMVVDDEGGAASITRHADGTALLHYRDAGIRNAALVNREVETTFKQGPLKCTLSAGAKFQTSSFDIKLSGKPSFEFAFDYEKERDGEMPRHAKVALVGPLTYELGGGFKAQAGFEGKAECSITARVYIPFGGLLAALLGFAVPVGIGVTADGSLKAVEVEFGPRGTVGADLGIGLECQSGTCIAMEEIAPKAEVHFESKVQVASDMKVGLGVSVHGIAGLDLILATRAFSLLEVRVGPKQALDLAFDDTQARDAAYASNYDLRLFGTISAGSDLKAAIEKIIGDERDLSYSGTPEKPLAQSPIGVMSADKARVQVDKPVKLVIDLDPKTIDYLLIGPNVAELRIARREKNGSLRPLTTIPVSASGQTRFEWTWEPGEEFLGMNELVAFVSTNGLPGVPLEIRGDSTAYVEVVDACLPEGTPGATPAPRPSTAAPGSTARPPRATPTLPPDPCAGNVTIRYTATSHLHAADWTITGNIERYEDEMSLAPDQPTDEYVGTGVYDGRAVDGLTMSLSYIRPPRCERDQLWLTGDGDVFLTAFRIEEGWFGAPFEGPAIVIGVFHKGDIEEGEMSPPYIDLVFVAAPADGGTAEYPFVVSSEAECGEEWARNISVTYAPTE